MRCALSSDKRMPRDNNLEVDHLLIRTGGFALSHRLAVITPGSGVSVVDSSDTCNHVAHSRTHIYRLNQLVGFSSRMDANRETAIIKQETPLRPGHHPLRSARASPIQPTCIKSSLDSSSPDTTIISIHQQNPLRPETDTSSANQDHQEIQEVSPQDITDGTTAPHSVVRTTGPREEHTRPETRSPGRSVDWSDTIEDQPTEEAVLQISGVGHWFLEGELGHWWVCCDPRSGGCEAPKAHRSISWDVRLVWCRSWCSRRSSGLLFTEGGVSLQLHRRDAALSGRVFTMF